jgi:hypothetical protein
MFDHVPHTPFQGLIINGNTSPPQIAGHAHDIRYRTKHPIDLQATSLQSSPTLPHPSSSHKTLSLSHFCPSLRLNVTKTLCFRTGGQVGMRNTRLRRSFSVRIQHAISLRRSLTGPGRDCFMENEKKRGVEIRWIACYRKGISQGGFTDPRQKDTAEF